MDVVTAGAPQILPLARGDRPFGTGSLHMARAMLLSAALIGLAQRRHFLSNSDVQLQIPGRRPPANKLIDQGRKILTRYLKVHAQNFAPSFALRYKRRT